MTCDCPRGLRVWISDDRCYRCVRCGTHYSKYGFAIQDIKLWVDSQEGMTR